MDLNLERFHNKIVEFTYKTKDGKIIYVNGEVYGTCLNKIKCYNYLTDRLRWFIYKQIITDIKILNEFTPIDEKMFKCELKLDHLVRFWNKVDKTNYCWNWRAATAINGYGKFNVNKKIMSCHRLSYSMKFGQIPDELCVCHKCDNTVCVNPDHLFLGTTQDNTFDRVIKKRTSREHQKFSKKKEKTIYINEIKDDVYFMTLAQRILPKKLRISQREISELYKISLTVVEKIIASKK